ncbi:hypothetical protein (nucleomorph) [Guillardia theta]|uniref:Uncharacterized protein n=1 Tax=Guillardia theta TaxID=55529 RepID=Q98S47_GUITH|nr:hypothetical protein GTHECHR3092 [Guillardia theta]AAK39736.1 hypothetical protein [Guillardia theta]
MNYKSKLVYFGHPLLLFSESLIYILKRISMIFKFFFKLVKFKNEQNSGNYTRKFKDFHKLKLDFFIHKIIYNNISSNRLDSFTLKNSNYISLNYNLKSNSLSDFVINWKNRFNSCIKLRKGSMKSIFSLDNSFIYSIIDYKNIEIFNLNKGIISYKFNLNNSYIRNVTEKTKNFNLLAITTKFSMKLFKFSQNFYKIENLSLKKIESINTINLRYLDDKLDLICDKNLWKVYDLNKGKYETIKSFGGSIAFFKSSKYKNISTVVNRNRLLIIDHRIKSIVESIILDFVPICLCWGWNENYLILNSNTKTYELTFKTMSLIKKYYLSNQKISYINDFSKDFIGSNILRENIFQIVDKFNIDKRFNLKYSCSLKFLDSSGDLKRILFSSNKYRIIIA